MENQRLEQKRRVGVEKQKPAAWGGRGGEHKEGLRRMEGRQRHRWGVFHLHLGDFRAASPGTAERNRDTGKPWVERAGSGTEVVSGAWQSLGVPGRTAALPLVRENEEQREVGRGGRRSPAPGLEGVAGPLVQVPFHHHQPRLCTELRNRIVL